MTTTTDLPEVHVTSDRSRNGEDAWARWTVDGPNRTRSLFNGLKDGPTPMVARVATFEDFGASMEVVVVCATRFDRADDSIVVLCHGGPQSPRPIAWVNGATATHQATILAWVANRVIESAYDNMGEPDEPRVILAVTPVLDPQET